MANVRNGGGGDLKLGGTEETSSYVTEKVVVLKY